MSRVVDFAAWTACTTGRKMIRGQREGEREQRQKEEEVGGGLRHWRTPVVSGKGEQRNRGGINSGVLDESRGGRSESSLAGWLTDYEDDVAGRGNELPGD